MVTADLQLRLFNLKERIIESRRNLQIEQEIVDKLMVSGYKDISSLMKKECEIVVFAVYQNELSDWYKALARVLVKLGIKFEEEK